MKHFGRILNLALTVLFLCMSPIIKTEAPPPDNKPILLAVAGLTHGHVYLILEKTRIDKTGIGRKIPDPSAHQL